MGAPEPLELERFRLALLGLGRFVTGGLRTVTPDADAELSFGFTGLEDVVLGDLDLLLLAGLLGWAAETVRKG